MYPSRIGCTKALDFKYSLLTIKTMAQNYSQLQAHIAKLQSEAETLRKSELAEVIAKIRVAISAYGITREDLFGGKSKTSSALKSVAAPMPASKSKSKFGLTAKFADGTGNTWVGRGPRPTWLREALAKGKSLADFAVAGVGTNRHDDLRTSPTKAVKKTAVKAEVKATKKPVAAKYQDDVGNSWTGRGSQPKWLKEAVAAGKTLDQLLV